jgi:hypothetical protein
MERRGAVSRIRANLALAMTWPRPGHVLLGRQLARPDAMNRKPRYDCGQRTD